MLLLEEDGDRAEHGLDLELVGVGHRAPGPVAFVGQVQDSAIAEVHDHMPGAVAVAAQYADRAVDEGPAGEPKRPDPEPLRGRSS
ncbi:hypothetical protein [Streptomyces wuyuanensis]|uniref:hypothetical protein n=1 Tax=Streptomyces wuyuanensis TaxID=1196353 RepID=UPI00115FD463|nr:hypothetical protein [Streptomyces wuyuanensis]